MDIHIKLITQIIGFILLALTGGIAWGKLNERVKKHDRAIDGCHMGDYQRKDDCAEAIANCSGSKHSAETYRRVVRMEADLVEMKHDLKESDAAFHEYQVDQGAAMARIETNINILLDIRGLSR